MKEERMMRILGQLPDSIIEEAMPNEKMIEKRIKRTGGSFMKKWWYSIGAAIVCVCAVGVWIGISKQEEPTKWPIKYVEMQNGTEAIGETNEIYVIPHWDEMAIYEQFRSMTWNGKSYRNGNGAIITAEQKGELLGTVTLEGYDEYEEVTHEKEALLFEIQGISSKCAVAVELDGTLYAYRTSDYIPETLGDLINDLNLRQNISFGSVGYNYRKESGEYAMIEFVDLPQEIVWEMLLADTTAICVTDYSYMGLNRIMGISVNIPIIGYQNISLAVTEEGYITTNILDTGKAFFIGEEKVQEFVDYVMENCQGYEIVYVQEGEIPENGGKNENEFEVETMMTQPRK